MIIAKIICPMNLTVMEEKYSETSETWNKLASLYQDKFMNLDLYNETYDYLCNAVTNSKPAILEIGCGPGNITRYLLERRPDFEILGIDIAPAMIELAKRNNPGASFEVMDTRNIDQIPEKYDAIVCGFCLPYVSHEDGRKLIQDCYNLLNDHGLVYISFVEGDAGNSAFQTASSGDRTYFYFYELQYLIEELERSSFENMKVFKVEYKRSENESEIHTIIIANK
jgi:2-polyprenyl-3-methyl-5-hydroxy-6-metoxy-1,4-benzoquinol methylase